MHHTKITILIFHTKQCDKPKLSLKGFMRTIELNNEFSLNSSLHQVVCSFPLLKTQEAGEVHIHILVGFIPGTLQTQFLIISLPNKTNKPLL